MIRVVPYDPAWRAQFAALKAKIDPVVRPHAKSIEHVGSTSVPGLCAKPIIDIDIVIAKSNDFSPVKTALHELGYEHLGDFGIEGREAFRCPPSSSIRHNLYVCVDGIIALQNHLALRDFLKNHDDARDQYAKLKLDLATKYPDSIDDYIEGKSEFILGILEQQGIAMAELERIRDANKAPSKP